MATWVSSWAGAVLRSTGLAYLEPGPTAALAQLLEAARTTEFYGRELRRLSSAPILDRSAFARAKNRFRSAGARLAPVKVELPWPANPPLTVVEPWFPVEAAEVLQAFDPEWFGGRRLDALAAPPEMLRCLANAVLDGRVSVPPLRYGAIALQRPGCHPFSEVERDRFWQALGAPVYLQLRGYLGELLATECDCHEGLHIDPVAVIVEHRGAELVMTSLANIAYPALRLATGLEAEIEESACACGWAAPRLMNLRKAASAVFAGSVAASAAATA